MFDANGQPLGQASVYRIDAATGAATLLGAVGVSADLPFFGAGSVNGTLYAFTVDTSTFVREIYTINQQTGKATFDTDVDPGLTGILSVAPLAPVPEPWSAFLTAAGFAIVFLRRRPRRP